MYFALLSVFCIIYKELRKIIIYVLHLFYFEIQLLTRKRRMLGVWFGNPFCGWPSLSNRQSQNMK